MKEREIIHRHLTFLSFPGSAAICSKCKHPGLQCTTQMRPLPFSTCHPRFSPASDSPEEKKKPPQNPHSTRDPSTTLNCSRCLATRPPTKATSDAPQSVARPPSGYPSSSSFSLSFSLSFFLSLSCLFMFALVECCNSDS